MAKNKNENTAFKERLKDIAFNGCDVKGVHYTFKNNQEFADFLGVSRQTLGFWLHEDDKKRRSPDMDGLIKVSKALNMSIDYLVGLSDINSLDADIQAVSRYTGLSEKAINAMNDDRFQAEMGFFLSGIVEHPSFNGIANDFMYAHHLASDSTDDKDGLLQETLDYYGKNPFVIVVEKTISKRMHEFCDSMSNYFKDYAYSYFDRIADISSTIVVEDITPEEIIPIPAKEDSEVK